MSHHSAPELLVVHSLRVLGHATVSQIAHLRELSSEVVEEHLEDARALGLAEHSSFGGRPSWHLTERGRSKGEAGLAEELTATGGRADVLAAHEGFLPLNRRVGDLMTQWQLRPTPADPLALNDHRDAAYDDAVLRRLGRVREDLRSITDRLTSLLARFDLHQPRIDEALGRAERGDDAWVDSPDVPSLNICWIQLHEDLLATLGIERGQDDPAT